MVSNSLYLYVIVIIIVLTIFIEFLYQKKSILKQESIGILIGKIALTIIFGLSFFYGLDILKCSLSNEDITCTGCHIEGIKAILLGTGVIIIVTTLLSYVFMLFHRSIKNGNVS